MMPEITVMIFYIEEDEYCVWNGRKNGYMTPEEWDAFIGNLSSKMLVTERGEKSE